MSNHLCNDSLRDCGGNDSLEQGDFPPLTFEDSKETVKSPSIYQTGSKKVPLLNKPKGKVGRPPKRKI